MQNILKKATFLFIIISFVSIKAQHNWIRTNPGGGGAIAMVGATANGTIVAGSDLSGVYTSTNNGATWNVIGATQGLQETHISSFGFHPTDGNTFIIGTGIGAYKTTDGGNTVYPVQIETDPNLGLGYVESIGMAISDASIGYMAHYEWWETTLSFLKTTDEGESWSKVNFNGLPTDAKVVKILVDQNNANLLYVLTGKARFACSDPNLYKSSDGGLTWTRIGVNYPAILDFDLHPTNPNIIYISTFEMNVNGCNTEMWQYATNIGETYKSIDGGINFTQIFDKSGIISVGTNSDNISVVDIINTSSSNTDSGTWKTINGGTSWTQTGLVQNWFKGWSDENYAYTVSFNGLSKTLTKDRFNPEKMYSSFGQWAWSTIDGGNHLNNISTSEVSPNHFLSTGLENINGNWIDVSDTNPNNVFIGGYDLGFWYSKNHGLSWKRSLPDYNTFPNYSWWAGGGSNCNFVLSDPVLDNVVWASFSADQPDTQSALFKSTAFGENWNISNNGLNTLGLTTHGISLDVNSPVGNRTLYVTQGGDVYKSVDDGANWTNVFANGGLKFTEVDKFNSQLIYAGGENGFWRSIDGGITWAEVGLPEMRFSTTVANAVMRNDIVPTYDDIWSNPPIVAWQGVFEIKADPNIANRVYVIAYGTDKGLYRSDDAGLTWTKLYTNDKMRGVAIASQNSNIIYASSSLSYHSGGFDNTSIGILVSYDAGVNWSFANDGMAWTNGGRLEIETGTSPHIWAWSPGTGVQHSLIPNFTLNIDQSNLYGNIKVYPNPVKNELTVDLTSFSGASKAVIYSITGKALLTIDLNENTVNKINTNKLSSGLYLLKINSESISETIKFVKH